MYPTTLVHIIDKETDKVLLGCHTRGIGEGRINFPGGKLHKSETYRQCACREVREETGLILQPQDLKKLGYLEFTFKDHSDKDHDCIVYRADTWSSELSGNGEMNLAWYEIGDIPFEHMWEDDKIWVPKLMHSEVPLRFDVKFDHDDNMLSITDEENIATTLTLIRHAHGEHTKKGLYDSQDVYPLSDRGRQEANELALGLASEDIDVILSSSFERCRQTIRPTADHHELDIQILDNLREIDHGVLSGMPYSREHKLKRLENLDFHAPEGESFRTVLNRVSQVINYIKEAYRGQNVVICTHGNPSRAFHYLLSEEDPRYLQTDFSFKTGQIVKFEKQW